MHANNLQRCTLSQQQHNTLARLLLLSWEAPHCGKRLLICWRASKSKTDFSLHLSSFSGRKQNWCEKAGLRLRACRFRVIKPWNERPTT